MQRFNELASHLLSGREIEFAYNGKQYSITNSKGRWMLYCDTDKLLLKDICDFEEREILEEGRKIRQNNDEYVKKIERIKQEKLSYLRSMNVEPKYLSDLERFHV